MPNVGRHINHIQMQKILIQCKMLEQNLKHKKPHKLTHCESVMMIMFHIISQPRLEGPSIYSLVTQHSIATYT